MADADKPPDDARDLELATHLNNLLRAYAEGDRRDGGGDALGMLLRLHEDLCRALCALAAEAAGAAGGRDGAGPRDWLARSRVADKLLFLVEAVFLVILNQADEVAERSYGFVEGSLGENLAGTVRDLLRRHADYGAFAADAVLGVEAAVGLDLFVAELRRLPPRPEELERALAGSQRLCDRLRGEVERLGAELALARARARGRPGGAGGDGAVLRRVRAAVARRFHPDAVGGGDPLARLVRQEVFKEMQQVLEEVERGGD
jgi:hypothetical protein